MNDAPMRRLGPPGRPARRWSYLRTLWTVTRHVAEVSRQADEIAAYGGSDVSLRQLRPGGLDHGRWAVRWLQDGPHEIEAGSPRIALERAVAAARRIADHA